GKNGIDLGATGARMFFRLDHQSASTFTKDKTVTVSVIRPRCGLWIIIAFRQCLHGSETSNRQWVNRSFRAAGYNNICVTGFDKLTCVIYGFGSGCTSGHGCHSPTAGTENNRDCCGSTSWHQHGYGNCQYAGWAPFPKISQGVKQCPYPADTGSESYGKPFWFDGVTGQAGVCPGFSGGNQSHLCGRVHASNFDPRQHFGRIVA